MRRIWRGWLAALALALTTPQADAQNAMAHADATTFPAGAPASTLLYVTAPGRFAISVQSRSGTALDLVDMITGPTEPAGVPGTSDGRLDLLLDIGTYKLRLTPAAGAQGDVRVKLAGFADAAPPSVMPADGQTSATLTDLQQRSFWFTAADQQRVRLEAAGRALADFRLWRNGRDLAAVMPASSTIEPTKGHPLRDLLIEGTLPAGVYRATLYGGPPLPWTDGAAAMPLHLRSGAPDTLRAGWVGGQIGPFGSEIFRAAPTDTLFRLSMEGPATLLADGASADIDKRARVPQAEVRTGTSHSEHWVEVRGPEHAPFQLRAMQIGTAASVYGPGKFFLTANTTGFGGDEVPATLVLGRGGQHGFTVIGSTAPAIGPGTAWRRRFNLGGVVSVIFHATSGGRIAATVQGVRLGMALRSMADMAVHPPLAPETPGLWDIPAGWYELVMEPQGNGAGVADLTLGTPGVTVPVGPPSAPSPSVGIGIQSLDWREHLLLFSNTSPHGAVSLDARPVPVSLDAAPLRLAQEAGAALSVPVVHGAGTLVATEFGKGDVPVTYSATSGEAVLPATDHPRLVSLAWHTEPAPPSMPTPEPEASIQALLAGTPRFFDIGEGDTRDFALTVPQGGLMRVETLGRLLMRGAIGTHFVPELQTAAANGVGHNMLLQGFLRAGAYHVDVTAEASSGHAGIVAAPAPMLTTTPLLPGAAVRATMPAGSGLVVPVDIAAAGRYRLDVLGLSRIFTARLEDAQGWPLAAAGPLDSTTQDLIPGRYRLLLLPEATDARAVIRLTRIEPTARLTGHGPHKLPFDEQQSLTWREPAGRNDPRTPDVWLFDLAAPSDISLSITDGMEGFLRRADGGLAGHFVGGHWFSGRLPQGAYRVEARSQGRNDRLDYALTLNSKQLQPGTPHTLYLPARATFTLASDRVVSLTSFGRVPVRAVLRDSSGTVLARAEARDNDWNIALSRPLPAGSYTLALHSAAPPQELAPPANVNDGPPRVTYAPDEEAEPDAPDQQSAGQQAAGQQDQPMPPAPDNGEAAPEARVLTELTFSLPDELPSRAFTGPAEILHGGGVQRLSLPSPRPGDIVLAGASSAASVVLSLEQQRGGSWRSLALAEGLAPLAAVPADGSAGAWRLSVWPVDGGTLPVQVAARIASQPAVAGAPQFQAAGLPGIADHLAAAHVALPSRTLLTLAGAADVLAGAWPGHAAMIPDGGLVAPQSDDLWILSPSPGAVALKPMAAASGVTITIPPGERVALPRQGAVLTGWIAEASGQPGLAGGIGMGVAPNGAFLLARQESVTAWNAGDGDTLRLTARPVPLAIASPQQVYGSISTTLPPGTATKFTLLPGLHRLRLDLPPGTAAVAGFGRPDAVTVWTGRAAVSRTLDGDWRTLLLVNTGTTAATSGLVVDALAAPSVLEPDRPLKQFFGAAGSFDLPVASTRGQTLMVAGTASAVFTGADGSVRRGKRLLLTGPGRVTLEHGAGLVVAWLDGAGATPWVEGAPYGVNLPATVPLTGAAMRIDLPPWGPALLRMHSTAPVILAMDDGPPMLFPAGAATSRYLPPGPHPLRVISPQDGPLSGTLDLSMEGVHLAHEGIGESVTIAPGDAALFGFTLDTPRRVGAGVRAEPDLVTLRLLDDAGHSLASGAALLRDLPAGRYVLEASVPAGAPTSVVRPALVGLVARPDGPPADVLRGYLGK